MRQKPPRKRLLTKSQQKRKPKRKPKTKQSKKRLLRKRLRKRLTTTERSQSTHLRSQF